MIKHCIIAILLSFRSKTVSEISFYIELNYETGSKLLFQSLFFVSYTFSDSDSVINYTYCSLN